MPVWVKVVLAMILIAMVLLLAGAMVAARWVRTRSDNLKKQGEVLIAEAKSFGQGKDGEACIGESLNRLRACQGFICEAKAKVFLQQCLTAANDSVDVCAGVPPPAEILASARWQIDACRRRGWADNQRCMRLLGGVQAHCGGKR